MPSSVSDFIIPEGVETELDGKNNATGRKASLSAARLARRKLSAKFIGRILLNHWKSVMVVVVVVVFSPVAILWNDEEKPDAGRMAYCAIIMASFWILELVPLAITGIMPVFLFPVLGVLDARRTCGAYFNEVQFIIMGGLIVAIAVEKSHVHERIALSVLMLLGSKPRWIMLGLMLVTAFLSMFLSNTATTAMMMPIANAILDEMARSKGDSGTENPDVDGDNNLTNMGDVKKESNSTATKLKTEEKSSTRRSAEPSREDKMMLLCVCYSAQLGGTGLLTGCTPNLVTLAYMNKRFPGSNMNFVNWSGFSFPAMLVVVLLGWVWLQICFMGLRSLTCSGKTDAENPAVRALIRRKYRALGALGFDEVVVVLLFFVLFLLWFTREPGFVTGYAVYFKDGYISDAVPAIFICLLLFLLPARAPPFLGLCFPRFLPSSVSSKKNPQSPGEESEEVYDLTQPAPRILDWETVHEKLPWCIVLIMGGGLALAEGMTATGLSLWLGERFSVFSSVPVWSLPFIIGAVVALTTDMASVMASCQIYTPVMADLALSLRLNPYLTLLPTTISASFAFMLPVATPPAAIAFSYGKLKIIDMCKAGFFMNVIGVLIVGVAVNTWGNAIFELNTFPSWAEAAVTLGDQGDANLTSHIVDGSSP